MSLEELSTQQNFGEFNEGFPKIKIKYKALNLSEAKEFQNDDLKANCSGFKEFEKKFSIVAKNEWKSILKVGLTTLWFYHTILPRRVSWF